MKPELVELSEGEAEVLASPLATLPEIGQKVARRTRETERRQAVMELQQNLLADATEVVVDTLRFREISPGDTAPPEEWVEMYGQKRANQMFKTAQSGWMSAKDAPVALVIAKSAVSAITKAMATENAAPRTLNVAVLNLGVAIPNFAEMELDEK